jgi:hypothetical protein
MKISLSKKRFRDASLHGAVICQRGQRRKSLVHAMGSLLRADRHTRPEKYDQSFRNLITRISEARIEGFRDDEGDEGFRDDEGTITAQILKSYSVCQYGQGLERRSKIFILMLALCERLESTNIVSDLPFSADDTKALHRWAEEWSSVEGDEEGVSVEFRHLVKHISKLLCYLSYLKETESEQGSKGQRHDCEEGIHKEVTNRVQIAREVFIESSRIGRPDVDEFLFPVSLRQ